MAVTVAPGKDPMSVYADLLNAGPSGVELANKLMLQSGEPYQGGMTPIQNYPVSEANDPTDPAVNPITGLTSTDASPTQAPAPAPLADWTKLLEGAGLDWTYGYSPAQQFRQYATTRFAPGTRRGFYGLQPQLLQRHMLRTPGLAEGARSFRDFMGGYGSGGLGMDYGGLRGLAEMVGAVSGLTGQEFLQAIDPKDDYAGDITGAMGIVGGMDPLQQAYYRQQYGIGQDAEQSQLGLASLLEQQRLGVQPGGAMSRAIASSLEELALSLMERDPQTNFLNWYLGQTKGKNNG